MATAEAEGDAENDRCTRFLSAVFLVRGPAVCVAWPAVAGHAWALLLATRGPSLRLCAAADAARRVALHSFWDELARRLDDSIDEPIRDDKAGGGGGHQRQSSCSSRPRLNSLGRAGSGKSGGSSDNVRAEVASAGSAMRSFVRWRVRTQRCAAVPMFETACIRAGVNPRVALIDVECSAVTCTCERTH